MTLGLCPARQMREFWSLFFITGRSHPLALGRLDFPRSGILWVFRVATVRENRLFLYSITREMHQRQLTLGLWPARLRREGSAFEDTEFSGAKQPSKETTDDLGNVNATRRCPPALGYRSSVAMLGEFPIYKQTTCNGNCRCRSVCRQARVEYNNSGQP